MSEAPRAGISALRLTLAAIGLTVGCCALSLLLGTDEAHADDRLASPSAPPAAAAIDPTGEASREATGEAVANSAMPALEAVAATLKTVTQLPVPAAEPRAESVAPLPQSPVESVVPLLQAAAEPLTPIAEAPLEPVVQGVLEPVTQGVVKPIAQPLFEPVARVSAPLQKTLAQQLSPVLDESAAESPQTVNRRATDLPAARSSAAGSGSGSADHPIEANPSDPAERSPATPTPVAALAAGAVMSGAPSATTDDGRFPIVLRTITVTQPSGGALPAGPSFDPGSTPD